MSSRAAFCILASIVVALATPPTNAQQRPDTDFHYQVDHPAYAEGTGPVVGIDGGHHNFHTAEDRYAPFARLVADDGFRVRSLSGAFEAAALARLGILVVANALNAFNDNNWVLPTPSAFTAGEIEAVRAWVQSGGSLLLIADHMPFAGAAADLAKAFGFGFINGYAFRADDHATTFVFTEDNGLILGDLGVGLPPTTKVVTFTGQAFTVPQDAIPLLVLTGRHVALLPDVAGRFDEGTPSVDVTGDAQGAIEDFGAGRVAVFGEAGAFSAQIDEGGRNFGMNADGAEENAAFALKVVRWLARFRQSG
jgi:hypothetical protein